MADFYKGYFDDRYSFAHSDKKWYNKNKDRVRDYNHNYYMAHKKTDTKNRFYNGSTTNPNQNPSQKEIDEMEGGTIFTQNGKYCVKTFDGGYVIGGVAGDMNSLRAATNTSKSFVKKHDEEEAIERDRKVRAAGNKLTSLVEFKPKKTKTITEEAQRIAADKDRYRKEIAAGNALHLNDRKQRKEMSVTERAQKLAAERRRRRV